jgi:ribosomal-protein-alanine N-acetyltransferase
MLGDPLNSFQIRIGKQADLRGICLVEEDSFSEPYPHGLIARLLQDCPNGFFVAERHPGTIIGYCVATENERSAHLISIGVLREYRRHGVGTALVRRLLSSLGSRLEELRLEVKEGNVEAIKLYDEIGFKQVERIPNYYEDRATAVKMALTLHQDAELSRR